MSERKRLPNGNVERPAEFGQVCVWQGTVVGEENIAQFESFFADEMKVRVMYLEEIVTGPGKGGPGGRNDVFFAVHAEDIGRFAPARFALQDPPRWLEDVFDNRGGILYPDRVSAYRQTSVEADEPAEEEEEPCQDRPENGEEDADV